MTQLRNIEPSSACNYYRGDKGILYNQREGDTSVSSVFFFSFLVTKSLIQLSGVMIQNPPHSLSPINLVFPPKSTYSVL